MYRCDSQISKMESADNGFTCRSEREIEIEIERERERENLNCILNTLVIYIYILSVLEVYSVSQSVEKKCRKKNTFYVISDI
jgi:hypothetical protein